MSLITTGTEFKESPPTKVVSATSAVELGEKLITQAHVSFPVFPSDSLLLCGWGIALDVRIGGDGTISVIVDLLLPREESGNEWYLPNKDDFLHPLVDPRKAIHLARGMKVFNAKTLDSKPLRQEVVEWSGIVKQISVSRAVMVVHTVGEGTGLNGHVRACGLLYE